MTHFILLFYILLILFFVCGEDYCYYKYDKEGRRKRSLLQGWKYAWATPRIFALVLGTQGRTKSLSRRAKYWLAHLYTVSPNYLAHNLFSRLKVQIMVKFLFLFVFLYVRQSLSTYKKVISSHWKISYCTIKQQYQNKKTVFKL